MLFISYLIYFFINFANGKLSMSIHIQCLLVKFARMCGATVSKSWNPNVTHVMAAMDEKGACTRTLKVLMAILNGRWVLTMECKI